MKRLQILPSSYCRSAAQSCLTLCDPMESVFNYFYIGTNAMERCFFMGIEVPFFLAESPNYFWKLEKKFRESGSLLVMYSNVIFMYLGQ